MSRHLPAEQEKTRRRVPFLGHQIAEYVVAVALLAVGFHLSGGAEVSLVLAGLSIVLLNLATAGPLGAVAWLSRRAHHAGDIAVVVLLAVAPVFFYDHLHAWGVVLSEAIAVLVVWMERLTEYGTFKGAPSLPAKEASPEPGVIESAGILASVVGPEVARASRQAAHHAGLVAGVTRRIIRQKKASRQIN